MDSVLWPPTAFVPSFCSHSGLEIASVLKSLPSLAMSSHRRPRNDSQELVDVSSLIDLELASPNTYDPLPEDNIASSTPLPDSAHESLDVEPLNVSQSPAELQSSAPSFRGRNHLTDTLDHIALSEIRRHLFNMYCKN